MSSLVLIGRPSATNVMVYDDNLMDWVMAPNRSFFKQRLPSEPIGQTTVTFDGVNAGSEIRVYLPDASEAAGVEACNNNHALTWNVYTSGSANNTVRVVIVHPTYTIKEFNYTSRVGAQSIPVQQEPDKWFSNPA